MTLINGEENNISTPKLSVDIHVSLSFCVDSCLAFGLFRSREQWVWAKMSKSIKIRQHIVKPVSDCVWREIIWTQWTAAHQRDVSLLWNSDRYTVHVITPCKNHTQRTSRLSTRSVRQISLATSGAFSAADPIPQVHFDILRCVTLQFLRDKFTASHSVLAPEIKFLMFYRRLFGSRL